MRYIKKYNENLDDVCKIDLDKFKKIYDPFNMDIWGIGIITKKMIEDHLIKFKSNNLIFDGSEKKFGNWFNKSIGEHLDRICFLIKNFDESFPIDIDFGIKGYSGINVTDGNHRLIAAYYLNKKFINAVTCGSVDLIDFYTYQ